VNEDGSDVKRLTPLTWDSFHAAWSPDGSRIAFVSVRDGNPDVYVMNADGSGELRLTNSPAIDTDPAWSPDGARIAFSSDRNGNHDIYIMSADGSGVTRVTNSPTLDRYPAWSPDGSRWRSRAADATTRQGRAAAILSSGRRTNRDHRWGSVSARSQLVARRAEDRRHDHRV
jgi:Tol biopolymer transport system component